MRRYSEHEITDILILFKHHLELVNAEYLSQHLEGKISEGWVHYRDPDKDWYKKSYIAKLDAEFKATCGINEYNHFPYVRNTTIYDNYISDLLDGYEERHNNEQYTPQDNIAISQSLCDWKKRILLDYSRDEHIKRLVWNLCDNYEEHFRKHIEYLANQIISPNREINFNEFHARGMCLEIINHNLRYHTSEDSRLVKVKAIDGLFGGYTSYGTHGPVLANTPVVTIPEKIYKAGLGYCTIIEIGEGVFEYLTNTETLILPKTLRKINWSFWRCRNLKSIEIYKNSCEQTSYITIDGVLFSGDGKELVAYPNRKEEFYEVPNGVVKIGNKAFKDCSSLKSIFLPETLTEIGINAFYRCENLKRIIVDQQYGSLKHELRIGDYGNVSPLWYWLE